MLFDKQAVLDHITQQAGPIVAQQASQMLPDQVDHEQHGELLQQFGIDPQNMANQLGGQAVGYGQNQGQQGGGYGQDQGQGGYGDDRDDRGGV